MAEIAREHGHKSIAKMYTTAQLTSCATVFACSVLQYTTHKGQKSLDDIMAEIARERGHKTIESENRGRMSSSESEEEFHSAGGAPNNNNGSSSDSNNNNIDNKVTSFALDNFSDDQSTDTEYEDAAHEHEMQGSSHPVDGISKSLGDLSVGRISSDAEVMVTPTSSAGGAAGDGSSSKAAAVHKHGVKHKHHGKHGGSQMGKLHVDEGSPAVGVLIDVTVHGHVNVGLIPNPEAQA